MSIKNAQNASDRPRAIVQPLFSLQAGFVKLREWDPAVATEAELGSWLRAYNHALVADLPDDPTWGTDRLRDYLSVTMPGERRLTWLAEDENLPGDVLGYGRMLMLDGLGVIELYVIPEARRQRVGEILLAAIAERAVMEGFTSLGVEVIGGTPAMDFYPALGFNHAYTEMRSILDLATVDWAHLTEMAEGVAHGYRIEYGGQAGAPARSGRRPRAASQLVRRRTPAGQPALPAGSGTQAVHRGGHPRAQ